LYSILSKCVNGYPVFEYARLIENAQRLRISMYSLAGLPARQQADEITADSKGEPAGNFFFMGYAGF
jgi:hypothetical protein